MFSKKMQYTLSRQYKIHIAAKRSKSKNQDDHHTLSLNISLTSGTVVSYGVFIKTGGLSFMSETRTIIGIFRLRLVDLMVHAI